MAVKLGLVLVEQSKSKKKNKKKQKTKKKTSHQGGTNLPKLPLSYF